MLESDHFDLKFLNSWQLNNSSIDRCSLGKDIADPVPQLVYKWSFVSVQLQRKTGKQWSDTLTDTNHQIMTHSSSTSQTELLQPQSFKVFNNHMQPFCRFTRNSAEVTGNTSQQRVRSILIQDQSEPFYILQQVARKVFNGRCCGQTHPKSLISLKDLY